MKITSQIQKILSNYGSDNPGTKASIAKFLMSGRLAGTGKMILYAVDQGFEHGPDMSFASNEDAYDPVYHSDLAIDAGLSGYAAPIGMLEAVADNIAGQVPLILKMNSSNRLMNFTNGPDQAVTASIKDALRLGCSGIGFTIYPGSSESLALFEEAKELIREAKEHGLASVVWSYARGNMEKEAETALDTISYGAHMSCLLGAHIVKVKIPTNYLKEESTRSRYQSTEKTENRISHVVKCCFAGRRMVIFSGGEKKSDSELIEETISIKNGGGYGSIVGRNFFQRPRESAINILNEMSKIYSS